MLSFAQKCALRFQRFNTLLATQLPLVLFEIFRGPLGDLGISFFETEFLIPVFGKHVWVFFSDILNLFDKAVHLPDVSYFVLIRLVLEILPLFVAHALPAHTDFLHNFKCSHLWIIVNYLGSCFFYKNHVSRKALLGLF